MGFNYAKEKTKFERQWTAIRKQCEEAGMEQELLRISTILTGIGSNPSVDTLIIW